jgi:hypothetical protein
MMAMWLISSLLHYHTTLAGFGKFTRLRHFSFVT